MKLNYILMAGVMATVISGSVCNGANAEGLFGGRDSPDGAVNMRRSTTEPYNPARGQSVAQRPRPDFIPRPIDAGGFQIFPAATVGVSYDDNIYAEDKTGNEESDGALILSPSIAMLSNWGRHAVGFTATGNTSFHNTNDDENVSNGAVQVEGRLDLGEASWVGAHANYQAASEPRGAPSAIGNAKEPTRFYVMEVGAKASHEAGRVKLSAGVTEKDYDYKNPERVGGGSIDTSARDRSESSYNAKIGYEVTQNFIPYVRADYSEISYDNNPLRESDGYGAVVGANLDFGGVTTADMYVGYRERDYDRFVNGQEDIVDFGGNLTWNVTDFTTIEASADRGIEETTAGGATNANAATSYTRTGASFSVTHELQRNLLLETNAAYTARDYNNFNREDSDMILGLGGRYYVNRNLRADLVYDYTESDSDVPGNDYDKNVIKMDWTVQY